jgi:hypothetical protein
VSELGDLLELLHGARRRWQTVRVLVRQWSDLEVSRRASERGMEQARARGAGVQRLMVASPASASGEDRAPTSWESQSRIWLDPGRARLRTERSGDIGECYSVRVGPRWWSFDPRFGATSNEGSEEVRLGSSDELSIPVDPALVMGLLEFEVLGTGVAAGRPALRVRATPRDLEEPMRAGHWLPWSADEFELLVDVERGVVLRLEARLEEAAFLVTELLEVAFDEEFDDEIFVFRAPPGEPVRSHAELHALPEAMSLEEAARRAAFTVLAPRRLPAGWLLNVLFTPGRERPPMPPGVVLHAVDASHQHQVRFLEGSDPISDALDWETVEFEGERYLVLAPRMLDSQTEVKLQRHGTHVRVTGNLERDKMLEIVHSLAPASPDLPPLLERE